MLYHFSNQYVDVPDLLCHLSRESPPGYHAVVLISKVLMYVKQGAAHLGIEPNA